jgi:hypothetical protein
VGTTRSRVNFFMNKFRKLGFIEYIGGLKINNSLLSVVLRDWLFRSQRIQQLVPSTTRGSAAIAIRRTWIRLSMAGEDLVVRALRELVDALDRRVAHVERLGEARIAREAAGLRKDALHRIQELTAASSGCDTREAERSGGVKTDDGGPKNEAWQ